MLRRFGQEEIIKINDITNFAIEQKNILEKSIEDLILPFEKVYIPKDINAIKNISLDFYEEKF
jgi:hypothetical protein